MNQTAPESPMDQMIRTQLTNRGINDARVLDAMRNIPRDTFFPPELQLQAYADQAAPIGHDQTISQPYIVGLMTQSLQLLPTHRVLEIGTGSGYQTAILARLAREIYTIERVKPLLDEAWERLMSMGVRNVHFRHGDGTRGWPETGPFDRILITAAGPHVPETLLTTQLTDGGLAVLPVGPEERQELLEVRRHHDELHRRTLLPCRFVKLIGTEGWPEK